MGSVATTSNRPMGAQKPARWHAWREIGASRSTTTNMTANVTSVINAPRTSEALRRTTPTTLTITTFALVTRLDGLPDRWGSPWTNSRARDRRLLDPSIYQVGIANTTKCARQAKFACG